MSTKCIYKIRSIMTNSYPVMVVKNWFATKRLPKDQTHLFNCSSLLGLLKRKGVILSAYDFVTCDKVVLSAEQVKLAIAYTLGSKSPDDAKAHLKEYNDGYKRLLGDNSVNVSHFKEAMKFLDLEKEMSVGDLAHKLHYEYNQIMACKCVIQLAKEYVQEKKREAATAACERAMVHQNARMQKREAATACERAMVHQKARMQKREAATATCERVIVHQQARMQKREKVINQLASSLVPNFVTTAAHKVQASRGAAVASATFAGG